MAKKLTKAQKRALELIVTGEFAQISTDNYGRHRVRRPVVESLVEAGYLKYINSVSTIITPAGAAAIGRADLFTDAGRAEIAPAEPVDVIEVGDLVMVKEGNYGWSQYRQTVMERRSIGVVLPDKDECDPDMVRVGFIDPDTREPRNWFWTAEGLELANIDAISIDAPVELGSAASRPNPQELERDTLRRELAAAKEALLNARDSLLDIRDLSKPFANYDDKPGWQFSRIFSHAAFGLRHSEDIARAWGMEAGNSEERPMTDVMLNGAEG